MSSDMPTYAELQEEIAQLKVVCAAARGMSKLYGQLWDLEDGYGMLTPEAVQKYDKAHEALDSALTSLEAP